MYKVIIADDEPLILAGLRHKVNWTALGFEIVAECADGQALLDAVTAKQPDLIVADIQMPHKTGLDVVQAIHNIFPSKVILISGYSVFQYAQEALRCGVVDYLLKPVASHALQEAVLKAKQQLALESKEGKSQSLLFWHYLKTNLPLLTDEKLLQMLTLSGSRRYFWAMAAEGPLALKKPIRQETAILRYNERVNLVLVHADELPQDHAAFMVETFQFEGDAGIAKPFENIRDLLAAGDEAYLCLATGWVKHGVHLWPGENARPSVKHYLSQVKNAFAAGNDAAVSALLSEFPKYIASHRLNIKHVETLYNSLMAMAMGEDDAQEYVTWQELRVKYASIDDLLSALHDRLVSGGDEDEENVTMSKVIVFRVKMLLQSDYAQSISLQDMATRFHIDKSYLSSLFHSEVGETFTNYLTGIRVRHACEYLATTQLSHSKIALLCGFNTDSYMKKVFRKVLGTTPSAYRKAHAQGVPPKKNNQKEEPT